MWRVVKKGRSPRDGSRGAGRWNPTELSVLYGAQQHNGAIAEIHFHISRAQSVFPSRMQHELVELTISTDHLLALPDMPTLARLGVDVQQYQRILYDRCQEIAAAAAFLGYQGLIAPSARWDCQNIVLFVNEIDQNQIDAVSSTPVDWATWRQQYAI